MKPKVLVTKHVFPQAVEFLQAHVEVEYHDSNDGLSGEELSSRVTGKRGLVTQLTDAITPELLDVEPELAVVSNVAVGFDNIDISAATKRKIVVTNTPEVLTDTTADFAFTLIMSTARRVVEADKFLRAGRFHQWEIDMFCGQDVHHRTLGLVGAGRIGQAVARRARGFDMRVLYFDVQRLPAEVERDLGLEHVTLETLLQQSDFVSVHVPLLPATRHLLSHDQFDQMKTTAILVNTSRGPVIDEAALAEALANGAIAGAGLDVYEREPEVERRLLEMEYAVLVPHIASASVATRTKMSMMAAENCVAVLQGERPPNPVNPEVLDGSP